MARASRFDLSLVFGGVRDLWFAKGRFLLMTTVVALVVFLVIMLFGPTAGLAAPLPDSVGGVERRSGRRPGVTTRRNFD